LDGKKDEPAPKQKRGNVVRNWCTGFHTSSRSRIVSALSPLIMRHFPLKKIIDYEDFFERQASIEALLSAAHMVIALRLGKSGFL
jgi:hypothetical protein